MPKRSIGIDIDLTAVHAVQLARAGNRIRIEKAFTHPMRRSTDSPEKILMSLVAKHGFDRRAAAAVTLAPQEFCYRTGSFEKELSDLVDEFPLDSGEIVSDRPAAKTGAEKAATLLVAASHTRLQSRWETLDQARMRAALLDTPVSALYTAVTRRQPERFQSPTLLIYLNSTRVLFAMIRGGEILMTRNLPLGLFSDPGGKNIDIDSDAWSILLLEMQVTWQKVFQQDLTAETQLVVTGPLAERTDILEKMEKELPGKVMRIDPFADMDRAADVHPHSGFILAQGLALRALDPAHTFGVNLFRMVKNASQADQNLKRQKLIFGVLLVFLAAVWLAGLFLRLQRLESRYDALKAEILAAAQTVLPAIDDIELALPMVIQQNNTLKNDSTWDPLAAGSPLEVLTILASHTPGSLGITIESLHIDRSIQLAGTCPSFSALQEWKKNLEQIPSFRAVQIQKQNKLSDRQEVQFAILIERSPEVLP